jgi:hypothetical protein
MELDYNDDLLVTHSSEELVRYMKGNFTPRIFFVILTNEQRIFTFIFLNIKFPELTF